MNDVIQKKIDRREFLRTAATALGAIAAVQLLGCGTEANNFANGFGSNPDGSAGVGDKVGSIEGNHSIPFDHVAIIKRSDLSNGQLVILSIQGHADHDHTLSLSSSDLADINSGKIVSKTSTYTNGHEHSVRYN